MHRFLSSRMTAPLQRELIHDKRCAIYAVAIKINDRKSARDFFTNQAAQSAGILDVFQGLGCAELGKKIRLTAGSGFLSSSAIKNRIANPSRCNAIPRAYPIYASFPPTVLAVSGSRVRTRFRPISAGSSGTPKTYLFCDLSVLYRILRECQYLNFTEPLQKYLIFRCEAGDHVI